MSTLSFPKQKSKVSLTPEQTMLTNELLTSLVRQIDAHFSEPDYSVERSFDLKAKTNVEVDHDHCFTCAIIFNHGAHTYRVFVLVEFKPGTNIETHSKKSNLRAIDRDDLNTRMEKLASNYAIWLERIKLEQSDFNSATKIILFDSWPFYQSVFRFPHHCHTYDEKNQKSTKGHPFGGQVDSVVSSMMTEIEIKKAS